MKVDGLVLGPHSDQVRQVALRYGLPCVTGAWKEGSLAGVLKRSGAVGYVLWCHEDLSLLDVVSEHRPDIVILKVVFDGEDVSCVVDGVPDEIDLDSAVRIVRETLEEG